MPSFLFYTGLNPSVANLELVKILSEQTASAGLLHTSDEVTIPSFIRALLKQVETCSLVTVKAGSCHWPNYWMKNDDNAQKHPGFNVIFTQNLFSWPGDRNLQLQWSKWETWVTQHLDNLGYSAPNFFHICKWLCVLMQPFLTSFFTSLA